MRRTIATPILTVTLFCLATTAGARAQTGDPPRIFILLPSQGYVPGVGIVGAPGVIQQREPFVVRVYAVDAFGNINFDHEGEIRDVTVAGDVPPPGEPAHPPARRFGTSTSGIDAATSTPGGSLRVSLGGSEFQEVAHAGAGTPQGVCNAIVTAIKTTPRLVFKHAYDIECDYDGRRHRFFAIVDRSQASATPDADLLHSITFDPVFGSAVPLKLGALFDPNGPVDPDDPAEYTLRNVDPPLASDLRFSRGMAVFEVMALHVSGPGLTLQVDQGSAGLEVVSTPFTVQPLQLAVESARLRDTDVDGSIDRAIIMMTEPLDSMTPVPDAAAFSLTLAGSPPIPGSAITLVPTADPGFDTVAIEVTFGAGIGKTDIADVTLSYSSTVGMTGAKSGTIVFDFTLSDTTSDPTSVRLIDAAPPVLVGTAAEDLDGNGGLDVLKLVFSEPIRFSGGRGASYGVPFDPAIDLSTLFFPDGTPLRATMAGLAPLEAEVIVVGDTPGQPLVPGSAEMDAALTDAIRGGVAVPAWGGATGRFDHGFRRFVLVSGTVGDGSSVEVGEASLPGDLAPHLKLGAANGGVERGGHESGHGMLHGLVVRGTDGSNLLFGQTEADVVISDNTIEVGLTNVPGSGTGTPRFFWRDSGDGSFVTDRAPVPNHASGMNNAGLDFSFNPKELLVEASATSGPDLVLQRTARAGDTVLLDASQSILPLTSVDDQMVASFEWRQVSGPTVPFPPNNGTVAFTPTVAGVYVFELVLAVPDSTGTAFNPYLDPDRTLRRLLQVRLTAGEAENVAIVLLGQRLNPGVAAGEDGVIGIPRVATEGVPYEIDLVATDAFHNETDAPPGAMARVTTTDPFDDEPPFQPFAGSRVRLRITPSDAATSMIPEVDDEVLVIFEHGDIARPYIVGSLWNPTATSETDFLGRVKVKFSWPPDPRAQNWNIYMAVLGRVEGNFDLYTCETPNDPDPTDAVFEDDREPPPGETFLYLGTMRMMAFGILQETSLGVTSAGVEIPNVTPCP